MLFFLIGLDGTVQEAVGLQMREVFPTNLGPRRTDGLQVIEVCERQHQRQHISVFRMLDARAITTIAHAFKGIFQVRIAIREVKEDVPPKTVVVACGGKTISQRPFPQALRP